MSVFFFRIRILEKTKILKWWLEHYSDLLAFACYLIFLLKENAFLCKNKNVYWLLWIRSVKDDSKMCIEVGDCEEYEDDQIDSQGKNITCIDTLDE